MKQYNSFIFESYSYDAEEGRIELFYSLDEEISFVETILLPSPPPIAHPELLDRALFLLHLIGGVSYFKTSIPQTMEVRSGELTEQQAAFFNEIYTKGLGEFFYKNDIDFRDLIDFPASATSPQETIEFPRSDRPRALVPLGGGKDSLVTLELLREAGVDTTLLRMGSHPIIQEEAKIAGLPLLTVERHLSGTLFDMNAQGALNGHVPITAYLSALSIVLAILYEFDTVVLSDERSAEEGNVEFHGTEINHQWSKSLAFERMFQEYLKINLTNDIDYFSLLRPMSELSIANIFCKHPEYFDVATSCNKNWKILKDGSPQPRWCGTCPKCAFSFLLFSAFLPLKDLERIFGSNFFENAELLPLYRELLGIEGSKPFECVGTPEEVASAFLLALPRGELTDTPVMRMFLNEKAQLIEDPTGMIKSVLAWSNDHAIPARFESTFQ